MKKRIFSLLVLLCMLVSMFVLPVSAEEADTLKEENRTATGDLCPCGCGETLAEIHWTVYNVNTDGAPTSGHYYLASDYVQNKQLTVMAGDRVVLDLRGHSLTSRDYARLYLVYGHYHLLDTVGGGRLMAKTSGGGYGGIAMISTNETSDVLFEVLSGTVMPDPTNKGSRRGGLFQVGSTATFRMTGGVLMNGSTVNGTYKEPGGAIAGVDEACSIEILGGQIIGCESSSYGGSISNVGTTILKNCEIIGGTSPCSGGNIYQAGGTLTIENAIIRDGAVSGSNYSGGNIALAAGAAMTAKNSTIRNGFAAYHGGNLMLSESTCILENTLVEAGVSQARGGNIYGATAADGLTIRNCELPGDVVYVGSGLKLEGKVKIGLLNNGLRLWYSGLETMVDASGLTEGSEIYVIANHTFTVGAANIDYFKGAIRTVLSETETGLAGKQAGNGEMGGYCPHCGEKVAWKVFNVTDCLIQECYLDSATDTNAACTGRHIESGHYYLSASLSSLSYQQYIGILQGSTRVSKDVVLDLAGYNITATGRAFYLFPGSDTVPQSKLTLLDSHGGSTVTGSGPNNMGGGVLYNEGSILNIYGGSYVYAPVSGKNVPGGGVIFSSGTVNLCGGTIDGSAYTYTDASTSSKTYTYNGGAIYCHNGNTNRFNMTAGYVLGGTAQTGGCMYFGHNNTVNITGGQFVGGVANKNSGGGGGCIRAYGTSTYKSTDFRMSGAAVRGGQVTGTSAGGGNFSIAYGTYNISDCYIDGGKVVAYGGNFTCGTSSNITVTDCIITDGTSQAQSGNIHVASTSTNITLENCRLISGTAKTYGGNLTCGNGTITLKGGQYLFGSSGTYGGNIQAGSGNTTATNHTRITTDVQGNAPLIAGGNATTYGGNLEIGGNVYLDAATFAGGVAGKGGKDIFLDSINKQLKLEVGAGVTGAVSFSTVTSNLGTPVYGNPVAYTACQQLNADILLEGDYSSARLCAKDGKLYVGAMAVIGSTTTWYTETADALNACDENSYIKLYAPQNMHLTKDCAIDLNGQTAEISGSYTLYGMDASGDGFTAPTGKAVVASETTVSADARMAGKRYIALSGGDGYRFHRLENRISGVSLRPSADGIYFTGSFGCDDTIGADVVAYGVAVSTVNMPGADFMTDSDTLYTRFDGASMEKGAQKTGVLISGILKEAERTADLNSAYGQMPIFATAYMLLQDGTVILSDDTADHTDDVACSLYDVMAAIDSKILTDPISYRKYTNPMRDFLSKWQDMGMGSWDFQKIDTPADDGVIDVLMIGSSFCYYYVEEMVGLAEAAGIPMRVCNVYYSGCPLEKHYNWWIGQQANYQFFDTTVENGRVQTNNVSLEWCLAQGEWDVISLQESSSKTIDDPNHLETTRLYYTTLLNYLMEQFPDARMMWHQPWTYQIGYDRDGVQITSAQQQQDREDKLKAYCVAICEEFGIERVNSGEAWQIVRSEYGYDNLCARLGTGSNHAGDYYHDGDIGGGQYLNACVWFEVITGISPVGNTYQPDYTYNGKTYKLDSDITYRELQEAAHKAVTQMLAEEK